MKKFYICVGGHVLGADGEFHFISARKLPDLYGIKYAACHFFDNEDDIRGVDLPEYIVLRPDDSGRYLIKEQE